MASADIIRVTEEDLQIGRDELAFPRSVYCLCLFAFGQRFAYFGIESMLAFYIASIFNGENRDQNASILYHLFKFLTYFMCLFGGFLADSWIGKYKSLFFLSVINAVGILFFIFSTLPPSNSDSADYSKIILSIIGMILVASGSGGAMATDIALGGDQFNLPDQQEAMDSFFSSFYIYINLGGLCTLIIIPLLRTQEWLRQKNEDNNYTLVFVVVFAVFSAFLVVLGLTHSMFKVVKPSRNVLSDFIRCIWIGLKNCCCRRSKKLQSYDFNQGARDENREQHWLDVAKAKFDTEFVEGVKDVLRMIGLFSTYPVFYALYDQLGSKWTFQASRMNGRFGHTNLYLLPEQMKMFNTLFVIIFIKVFDKMLYPSFAKCNLLKKPLQKIVTGGVILASAFFASALLESQLAKEISKPELLKIHIVNGLQNCMEVNATLSNDDIQEHFTLGPELGNRVGRSNQSIGKPTTFRVVADCNHWKNGTTFNQTFSVEPTSVFIYLWEENEGVKGYITKIDESLEKSITGNPLARLVFASDQKQIQSVSFSYYGDSQHQFEYTESAFIETNSTELQLVPNIGVCIHLDTVNKSCSSEHVPIGQGGSYTIFATTNSTNGEPIITYYETIVAANEISVFWQLPQILLLTFAELMFSLPNLQFAYTQAPASMKSVLQALFRFTMALGNLLDMVVMKLLPTSTETQAIEFVIFACLMLADVFVLALLARQYRYKEEQEQHHE